MIELDKTMVKLDDSFGIPEKREERVALMRDLWTKLATLTVIETAQPGDPKPIKISLDVVCWVNEEGKIQTSNATFSIDRSKQLDRDTLKYLASQK